jgi:peroxiredoxin
LRGIEKALNSLEGSGIRPVAISADTPEESRELCRKAGLTFPILSDRNAQAIRH